jgi:hypothetical protein
MAKIVVCEDDVMIQKLIFVALRSSGHEIVGCNDRAPPGLGDRARAGRTGPRQPSRNCWSPGRRYAALFLAIEINVEYDST